ncbi:MAG: hypothetical protein WC732_05195 [Candidatus Omnitrophota bacterium]
MVIKQLPGIPLQETEGFIIAKQGQKSTPPPSRKQRIFLFLAKKTGSYEENAPS